MWSKNPCGNCSHVTHSEGWRFWDPGADHTPPPYRIISRRGQTPLQPCTCSSMLWNVSSCSLLLSSGSNWRYWTPVFCPTHHNAHTHARTLACSWKRASDSLRNTGGGGAAAGSNWGGDWGGGVTPHWGDEGDEEVTVWKDGCEEVRKLGSGSDGEE